MAGRPANFMGMGMGMGERTISDRDYQELHDKANRGFEARMGLLSLLEVVKNSVLIVWWTAAIAGSVVLWFYPVPEGRLQPVLFAVASVLYALLSRALYKVKELEAKGAAK
jgi:hypothetical protein